MDNWKPTYLTVIGSPLLTNPFAPKPWTLDSAEVHTILQNETHIEESGLDASFCSLCSSTETPKRRPLKHRKEFHH